MAGPFKRKTGMPAEPSPAAPSREGQGDKVGAYGHTGWARLLGWPV